jgi:hypothetical protein
MYIFLDLLRDVLYLVERSDYVQNYAVAHCMHIELLRKIDFSVSAVILFWHVE